MFKNSPVRCNKIKQSPLDSLFRMCKSIGKSKLRKPKLRAQQRFSKERSRESLGSCGSNTGPGVSRPGWEEPSPHLLYPEQFHFH